MEYQRPLTRRAINRYFDDGIHQATIKSIETRKSKKSKLNMFVITIEGSFGEEITYYLTFDTSYTEKNLNYILASIEANGVDIPLMKFGFNRQTDEFLTGKKVYINVGTKKYKGVNKAEITAFLTKEEVENQDYL